eukprot:6038354-Pyramimonas_sp.AAC.1
MYYDDGYVRVAEPVNVDVSGKAFRPKGPGEAPPGAHRMPPAEPLARGRGEADAQRGPQEPDISWIEGWGAARLALSFVEPGAVWSLPYVVLLVVGLALSIEEPGAARSWPLYYVPCMYYDVADVQAEENE